MLCAHFHIAGPPDRFFFNKSHRLCRALKWWKMRKCEKNDALFARDIIVCCFVCHCIFRMISLFNEKQWHTRRKPLLTTTVCWTNSLGIADKQKRERERNTEKKKCVWVSILLWYISILLNASHFIAIPNWKWKWKQIIETYVRLHANRF